MQKIDFVNSQQPAINDTNLNLMQTYIETAIQGAVSGDTLPIGAILPFGGGEVPDNYMLCDGSAVSRTTYSQLFSIIGTSFGVGDGSTTFNLPDLRGKHPMGYDSTQTEFNALGKTGGEKKHTQTIEEMPSHNHELGINGGSTTSTRFTYTNANDKRYYSGTDLISNTGGGQPFNVLDPYATTNYIIKAFQTAGVVAEVVNSKSTSTENVYSANYINKMFDFSDSYNYSGSVMTSNNGTVQSYSSVTIHVNKLGTIAYVEGTLYNNHSTAGAATITFSSALRPSATKSALNILTNYNNALTGENMSIDTNGTITMSVYGTASGNSRHTITPTLIWL